MCVVDEPGPARRRCPLAPARQPATSRGQCPLLARQPHTCGDPWPHPRSPQGTRPSCSSAEACQMRRAGGAAAGGGTAGGTGWVRGRRVGRGLPEEARGRGGCGALPACAHPAAPAAAGAPGTGGPGRRRRWSAQSPPGNCEGRGGGRFDRLPPRPCLCPCACTSPGQLPPRPCLCPCACTSPGQLPRPTAACPRPPPSRPARPHRR